MPIYEYRCTKCGHQFEVYQQISEAAVSACEQCGAAVRRVFSPVGIIFKGSGFHATDYRKESGKSGGSKDAAADTKSTAAEAKSTSSPDGASKAGEASKPA